MQAAALVSLLAATHTAVSDLGGSSSLLFLAAQGSSPRAVRIHVQEPEAGPVAARSK